MTIKNVNINTDICYDKKRKDITFCTMLFRLPGSGDELNSLKSMDRKFEDFYLPSLKQLIETFENVALWCDRETVKYLDKHNLSSKINVRVLDFQDLPHYSERIQWLEILNKMRKNTGFLLHNKTPLQWIDYMILIMAKPSVIDWAARNNKFKSKYFMWVDGGGFNVKYRAFWENWTGHIDAKPKRCRFTIAPTLGKSHPRYVPKPIYSLYNLFKSPIKPANAQNLLKQSLTNIAMINADYDVPATCFMIPQGWASRFYERFEDVRKIMKKHGLVSTEQAVFQTMMKLDTCDMFELSYIHGYTGVYAAVAMEKPDYLL